MSKKFPAADPADRKSATARPSANLRLRLKDGQILARASANLDEFEVGIEIVEILRILSKAPHLASSPKRLSKALHDSLCAANNHVPAPQELPLLLREMTTAGVMAAPNEKGAEGGFADPWIQWAMLADSRRVERYREAIHYHTTSQTRALDVGAGNGVLSAMLLRAGAEHVLAIEESATAEALRRTIKPSGRFDVFSGHSRDADLPSNINLIVSELFGHDPFSEGVLETLRDIQSRLRQRTRPAQGIKNIVNTKARQAGKGGQAIAKASEASTVASIPASVTVHWACAEIHSGPLCERLALWNTVVNGSALRKAGSTRDITGDHIGCATAFKAAEDWSTLSFPFSLRPGEFSLRSPAQAALHVPLAPVPSAGELLQTKTSSLPLSAVSEGGCVLLWFTSELAPGVHISSLPDCPDSCAHWSPLIVPFTARLTPEGGGLHMTAWVSECQTRLCCEIKQGNRTVAAR